MMILFLIITAALTLYAVFHIVAPFFQSRQDQLRFEVLDEDLRIIEELVAKRTYLLNSLRELQLDHDTGKIPDDDYEQTRKKLELEAVTVLRELDDVHGGRGWQDTIDEELQQRLDGIRSRRGDNVAASPETTEDAAAQQAETSEVESEPESDAVDQIDCPDCGKTMDANARFCSQCGHAFDDDDNEVAEDEDGGHMTDTASVDDVVTEQQADIAETSAEVAR